LSADDQFDEVVKTQRLELVLMTLTFMEALQRRDLEAASGELGASVPVWLADDMQDFLEYRLAQVREDPGVRGWLGRSMVVTEADGSRHVVGSIGFAQPDRGVRLRPPGRADRRYRRPRARLRNSLAVSDVRRACTE